MPPISASRSTLLRLCPRQRVSTIAPPILAAAQQRRCKADIVQRSSGETDHTPRFESPVRDNYVGSTTRIPDWGKYMAKGDGTKNKTFSYFMVGGMGLLAAAGAKATVQGKHSNRFGEELEYVMGNLGE